MKGLWVASIGAAVVAVVLLTRMAGYLVDVEQPQCSLEPHDKWRTAHSCLTAYAEAARFAAEAERNVYDPALYEGRFMSGLKVDTYHYPPPFLVVPDALQRATGGYLELRPVWFGLQLAALLAAVLLIARWLGGELQPRVLLGAPLFFLAPTTLFTLQMGNFQSTAFALSLLGMIGLVSTRAGAQALGALAFAFAALSKVFPGVLGIYLIVTRRWRALAWIAGASVALVAAALAVYGTQPFADFIHYQVPRLSSGEAFPQAEGARTAAGNMSFYGALVKLRTLGITGLDRSTGLAINSIYGVLVLALAAAACWRQRRADLADPDARFSTLMLWLALLDLASMRSPFVGGAYGIG